MDWFLYDIGLRHERVKFKCRLGFSRFLLLIFTFFTAMAEKNKEPGKDNILSKTELIIQKLSSETKTTTTKLAEEGPREFVEDNYYEIITCTQHFKEKRNCDVLASEQGPSCTRLDQLPILNLIFIRFTTPTNNDSASESWILPTPMKKAKSFENKTI